MTYSNIANARSAIREFDGANANGQPIRLSLLPSGPSAGAKGARDGAARNPFDYAVKPGRSLFDRIEEPRGGRARERHRSRSPGAPRRTDTRKPPPEGVDRYVPDGDRERLSRSRSPMKSRRRNSGRRNGENDTSGRDRGGRGEGERQLVNGRPRVTQEELDREM